MKNFNKHELDEIFRQGLVAPELEEVDEDWALMKSRLQSQKRLNIVPSYLIFISAIAAVFLLVFAVNFISSISVDDVKDNLSNIHVNANPVLKVEDGVVNKAELWPKELDLNETNKAVHPLNTYYGVMREGDVNEPTPNLLSVQSKTKDISEIADVSTNSSELAIITPEANINGDVIEDAMAIKEPLYLDNPSMIEEDIEAKNEMRQDKSRFSLAINFAPDLNGVEQLQNNKLSYSLGAAMVYKISNKLSVDAGAAYGKKTYQTGFSSFKPSTYNLFQVKPNIVSSGFDVMDIQLNLDYTLLKKGRSTIGVGAGISSYLMLDEQYSFTYQNLNARGLSSFRTGYQNNHFLGIANLNLSYKRDLTNKIKLAFNPYLKLPLTDLGYGNIRLRSAGLSVGVITNFNKSEK